MKTRKRLQLAKGQGSSFAEGQELLYDPNLRHVKRKMYGTLMLQVQDLNTVKFKTGSNDLNGKDREIKDFEHV